MRLSPEARQLAAAALAVKLRHAAEDAELCRRAQSLEDAGDASEIVQTVLVETFHDVNREQHFAKLCEKVLAARDSG